MPLIGALLNQHSKLDRLGILRRELLRESAKSLRQANHPRPRNGAIQAAVIKVLAAASPEPMHAAGVHAAVERLLNVPVSRDTINSCLSTGACGAEARFERLGRGRYRLLG